MTIDVTKVSTDVLVSYLRSGAGDDPYEPEAARRLEVMEKDQAELLVALQAAVDRCESCTEVITGDRRCYNCLIDIRLIERIEGDDTRRG